MPIHKACASNVPFLHHREVASALVCGTPLRDPTWSETLRRTGLLHLIVVSGSHLLFLEHLLYRLFGRSYLADLTILFLLTAYALATGFEPPIVRAGLGLLLAAANARFALGWSRFQITLLSGFVTLGLFPVWLRSLSLLFSWTASLALAASPQGEGVWQRQFRVYFALWICLLPLSPPHPMTVVFNVVLGPILGALLFPLSLATWALHVLAPLLDAALTLLKHALRVCESLLGVLAPQAPPSQVPTAALWGYLIGLQVIFVVLEIRRGRRE